MGDYEVLDGSRRLRFTGQLLGRASSDELGKRRWTEHEIYRTRGGQYVVVTKGCSRVEGEDTRSRALVSSSARGVIESLYQVDDDEVSFLTNVARDVIEAAAGEDDGLARAWSVEIVA
jgi:EXLDI family protein